MRQKNNILFSSFAPKYKTTKKLDKINIDVSYICQYKLNVHIVVLFTYYSDKSIIFVWLYENEYLIYLNLSIYEHLNLLKHKLTTKVYFIHFSS